MCSDFKEYPIYKHNNIFWFQLQGQLALHYNKQGIASQFLIWWTWLKDYCMIKSHKTLMRNWFDKLIIQVCKRADQLFVNLTFKFNQMVTGLINWRLISIFCSGNIITNLARQLHGRNKLWIDKESGIFN